MTGCCAVCQAAATQCCSSCRNTFYCSRDHQKQHWKIHKTQCIVYKVESTEALGRHMVAVRDVKQGEVILRESPIVVGPKVVSLPMCLGCHRRIKTSDCHMCSGCGWPMCGPQCEKLPVHMAECKVMKEKEYRANITCHEEAKKEAAYCSITPLRCLLLKSKNSDKYKTLLSLESHLEERRNTTLYNILRNNVVGFIRNVLGLEEFDEETILQVAAILDTNAFEVRQHEGDIKVRALYPNAAMMSHDCKPNTKHVFEGPELTLILIATVPITKGEVICATYTQTLWGTLARKAHLKASKCFDCVCERCSDPSELGTYLGAICCSRCKETSNNTSESKLISTDPLDPAAPWQCEVCDHMLNGRQMTWGNDAIRQEILRMNKSNPKFLEEFLDKYKDALHATNSHVLEVKYALCQMYGNLEGYSLSEISDKMMERKIDLCHELLEMADILDPGASRLRGLLLYDLQAAMAVQAKREFNNDKITKAAAQEVMKDAMGLLQHAAEILRSEPDMAKLLPEKMESLANQLDLE